MLKTNQPPRISPPPKEVLKNALGVKDLSIEWLTGDGSDRCYYRINLPTDRSYVLMQLSKIDGQNLAAGKYDWIQIADLLREFKIKTPQVIAIIDTHAAIIIEDYGDHMLQDAIIGLNQSNKFDEISDHYQSVFNILAKFATIPKNGEQVWAKRGFNSERFKWELDFFKTNFLNTQPGLRLSGEEEQLFERDSLKISDFLGDFSHSFVHRDFHSRNIMLHNQVPAILDFQDARLGPPAYDLVSLIFDSYTFLNQDLRIQLLRKGIDTIALTAGLEIKAIIENHWRPMLLQRQLKAIGSFGYLTLKQKRGNYLKYIPAALETLQNCSDERWPFLSRGLLIKLGSQVGSI